MTEHEFLNSPLVADEGNLIQFINQLQLRWSKTLLQALRNIVKPEKKFGEWIDRVDKFDGEKWQAARFFRGLEDISPLEQFSTIRIKRGSKGGNKVKRYNLF